MAIKPSITGTSPSDCLVSYTGHSLWWESYPSAEKQSLYSTAPADRAIGSKTSQKVYGIYYTFEDLNSFLDFIVIILGITHEKFAMKQTKQLIFQNTIYSL